MTNILLAFLEGLALIASPCILPILPLVLATSATGGKSRPFGIVIGFVLFFSAFALLSRAIINALGIDQNIIRNVSIGLLAILGLVMMIPFLSDRFSAATDKAASFGQNLTSRFDGAENSGGFLSGLLIGGLIGLVWTPCAGPILAAAVVQIALAKDAFNAVWTVLAFAIGAAVPMFFIAFLGRTFVNKLGFLKTNSQIIRRVMGAIVLLFAAAMFFGLDTKLLAGTGEPSMQNVASNVTAQDGALQDALPAPIPAPDFANIIQWFNTEPLTIQSLRGKVVLVDFWTYSCINCLRTLPVIKSWYEKYHDQGLVIVGVHTPEFEFEKKPDNVATAIQKLGIRYPVALDNNYATWSAFDNKYWPAHYLIDQNGKIVFTHFGEGHYDVTEHNIRALLKIHDQSAMVDVKDQLSNDQSPETYLGSARMQNFSSLEKIDSKNFTAPISLQRDHWALSGDWTVNAERIESNTPDAALRYHFKASKVFLVMGSADRQPLKVTLTLDGKPVADTDDIKNSVLNVQDERLYTLIESPAASDGVVELHADRPGLQAYAFTFGQ